MSLRFQILGPVEARDDTDRIEFSAAKVRTMLAALLLGHGGVVSDSRLTQMLWGKEPPSTADAQIQTYISRIRQRLGPSARITRQRPGYQLCIRPEQLDLVEFERLASRGRQEQAAGRLNEAVDAFRAALAVWRGPALGGVTEFLEGAERLRLEEARLAVLAERIDVDLALGRHPQLTAELTGLVAAHPLEERLRGQLMLTLYRNGRQADALSTYQESRRLLAEELGVDPSRDLRKLYLTLLTADADLDAPAPATAALPPARVEVRTRPTLPADIADFTGRVREAAQVEALLRPRGGNGGRRVACVISGMAGVGKTALAIHVAHRLAEEYPDGQLFLDLRGCSDRLAQGHDLLRLVLRALGVAEEEIPGQQAERAEFFQSRLAGQRVLLVLDNAATERQVRLLLPESATCGVLITSRTRLTALEGVPLIDLEVLGEAEAVELLGRVAGPERVLAEPEAAGWVVQLCGYLPLGVRIAGARLAAKRHWLVARLAGRLSGQYRRLDELQIADLEVRSCVALSLSGLDEPSRRAFRLLALLDESSFEVWTAAVVLDRTLAATRDLLERLTDVRLLEIDAVDGTSRVRYYFHDLVRMLALERVVEEETAQERYFALDRAFGLGAGMAEDIY